MDAHSLGLSGGGCSLICVLWITLNLFEFGNMSCAIHTQTVCKALAMAKV